MSNNVENEHGKSHNGALHAYFAERAIKVMGENHHDLFAVGSVRRHRSSADCALLARFQANISKAIWRKSPAQGA